MRGGKLSSTFLCGTALAALAAGAALANPSGATVAAGGASISSSGAKLTVNQKTKIVIINWNAFNIGNGETTQFVQPSSGALAVNRIGGANPAQILGNLLANGRVILIDGNGILFGPNAQVNVNSLIATTSDASNAAILAGKTNFNQAGNPNAAIVNQGTINAAKGGLVGLIAPSVSNSGVISAKLGTVQLAGSNVFTLDFTGDGLISFPVDPTVLVAAINAKGQPVKALVSNAGKIEGATVVLTARAAANLVENAISMTGEVVATAAHEAGGKIVLDSGQGNIAVAGGLNASSKGENGSGGQITITATSGTADVAAGAVLDASGRGNSAGGSIDVNSTTTTVEGTVLAQSGSNDSTAIASGAGGTIAITGTQVGLTGNAVINASGASSGGTILVGGDYHGANPLVSDANATYVGPGVTLAANALNNGNGGKVIVWSNEVTRSLGTISATGGPNGGNGGFVENSSAQNLDFNASVNVTAAKGNGGTLLLDPSTLTIVGGTGDGNTDGTSTFSGSPSGTTGTVLFSDTGPTTIYQSELQGLSAGTNIVLQATDYINVSGTFTGAGAGTLLLPSGSNLTLSTRNSSTDGTGTRGIDLTGSTGGVNLVINSQGGNITLQTGTGVSPQNADILTAGLTTGGGTVTISATGNVITGALDAGAGAISINAGGTITQGSGSITAGTLSGSSFNGATLTANNAITSLGNFTDESSSGFSLTNGQALSVSGSVSSASGPVTIDATGSLTIATTGSIAGSAITLASSAGFINDAGASALSAQTRWLVYSSDPASDTFDSLNSNNTPIWNATVSSLPPANVTQSGNIYLFANQPTLTFTSTSASKTYGTNGTSAVANDYSVSGFQPAQAGAYLADSAANVYSGAPSVTSSGSGATAHVAGGPYTITAAAGTLAALNGYAFSFSSPGQLTVDPEPLTPILTNSGVTKTYDGTTNAPGGFTPVYSFSGLVSGDTSVTLSNTGASYNSAHVISATQLTVSGLSISSITGSNGSLASDYALSTSSVSVAASITQATLTALLTNSGVTKTYDGTTSAPSGFAPTYSVTGFVSGDTSAILTNTGAAYNSAHVANATQVTVSGLRILLVTGSNGSLISDYRLASNSVNVAAVITPLTVTATAPLISGLTTKVYDGTTAATGATLSGGSVSGAVSGDSLALNTTGITLSYNSSHVATASSISATGSLSLLITSSTNGSLSSDYSLSPPTISSVAGTIAPETLTPTLTNSGVTRTYDGTTNAPPGFTPTYSFSGLVSGDTSASLSNTGAFYNSAHVVSATQVTVSGLSISSITGSNGSQVSDYNLASSSAVVAASITPAPLTVGLSNTTNVTRIYDSTNAAPGGFSPTYSISGLVAGDSATVSSSATPVFNSAHVASATAITQGGLSLTSITGNGTDNSVLGDYTLSSTTAATGAGIAAIVPATLTPTLTNSGVTKTYDGTTNAPGGFTPTYSFSGLVSGDTGASLTNTGASFDNAHVASATGVTVSGLSIGSITGSNGSLASDYALSTSSVSAAASITPAPLTVNLSNTTNVTKTYDGTTAAPGGFSPTYSVSGLVSGDSATVSSSATPVFNSAHVASATAITQSGLSLNSITGNGTDNSILGDYTLSSTTAATNPGIASITPLTVTATAPTIVGTTTKVYDGTRAATGATLIGGSVSGALSGDVVSLDTGAIMLSYNSSHVATASNISATGSLAVYINSSTNGSLSSDYSLSTSSIAPVAGTITPATLTATLTNSGVTKTYDGTINTPAGFTPTYSFGGLVSGDTGASLSNTSAFYNSAHVVAATDITVSGLSITGIIGSNGSQASDYTLASSSASVAAAITPATLTAVLTNSGVTKTYDGTTSAPAGFTPTYSVFGFASGDVAASLNDTSAAYNSAHVATATQVTVSGLSISGIVGSNGSLASDYTLASNSVNVAATITPATLTAALTNSGVTKSYDGTTNAPAGFTPAYSFAGFVSGDTSASLSDANVAYDSSHVASATSVTVSGLSISGIIGSNGSQTTDYSLGTSSVSVAATVTPGPLTVSLSNVTNVTKTYDGTTATPPGFTPTYSFSGLVAGDSATASSSATPVFNSAHVVAATSISQTGVSLASITGNGTDNSVLSDYSLSSTVAATGNGVASISPAIVTAIAPTIGGTLTRIYDGTTAATGAILSGGSISGGAITGDTLALNTSGITLIYNSSHVASANSISASGSSSITVSSSDSGSLASDYSLTPAAISSVAGTITPIILTATAPTIGGTTTKIYDGTTAATGATLIGGSVSGALTGDSLNLNTSGITLSYNSSHVASASSIGASGSLSLDISATTNGSQSTDYHLAPTVISSVAASITAATLTPTLTNSGVTKAYDGTANAPAGFAPAYSFAGLVSGDTSASLSSTSVAYNSSQVATATGITVSGLSISGITGSNGSLASDYALATSNVAVAATITPATLTVTAANQSKTYGQALSLGTNAFTASGLLNSDSVTGVTLNSSGAAATASVSGSPYTITASNALGSGLANYAITYDPGSLTVNPASLTVTAANQGKNYGQALSLGTSAFTASGLVNSDSVTGVTLNSSGAVATASVSGSPYTITASNALGSGLANYAITYDPGSLTVNPASLTITAANQSKNYGQLLSLGTSAFTASGLLNSDSVTGVTFNSSGAAATASVSGSPYTITASNALGSGLANYAITYDPGSLTVSPASLTITAANQGKTYGQTLSLGTTAFTASGLLNSDIVTGVTLNSSGAAATASVSGSPYTITASNALGSGLANYAITYDPGSLTVNPASLTITAANQGKTYGQTLSLGTTAFTTSGLLNSDSVTGVTLNGSGTAATASVGGSPYTITASNALGSGLANYAITYDPGSLTVNPASLTITAANQDKNYGQLLSLGTTAFTAAGLLNSDIATAVTLSSSGAAASAPVSGSPYTITASNALGSGLANYAITYDPGLLTVVIAFGVQTPGYGNLLHFSSVSGFPNAGSLFNSVFFTNEVLFSTLDSQLACLIYASCTGNAQAGSNMPGVQ